MMKTIIATIAILVPGISAHSQDQIRETSLYFIVGGSDLWCRDDAISNRGIYAFSAAYPVKGKQLSKTGYGFGFALEHRFSKHFALNTRLLSEEKGTKSRRDNYSYTYNSLGQLSIDYLDSYVENTTSYYVTLSVVPQFLFKRFNIGVGGYFATPYKSNDAIGYYNYPPPSPTAHNIDLLSSNLIERLDYGASINIGYTLPYGNKKFTIQAVSALGLKNALGKSVLSSSQAVPALYLNTFSLFFGISFNKLSKSLLKKINKI